MRLVSSEPLGERWYHKCPHCGAEKVCRQQWEHSCPAFKRNVIEHPCRFLGAPTGRTVQCKGCPGKPREHETFACAKHGECLPLARAAGLPTCEECGNYQAAAL